MKLFLIALYLSVNFSGVTIGYLFLRKWRAHKYITNTMVGVM